MRATEEDIYRELYGEPVHAEPVASPLSASVPPEQAAGVPDTDTQPNPWTEPAVPLGDDVCRVRFPAEALPYWAEEMVGAVAEATQTDQGMAGTVFLGMLATVTTGRVSVEIRPGWVEPCNLFASTAADPANRKTAVFSSMSRPVIDAERVMVSSRIAHREEQKLALKVAEQKAEAAKRAAAKDDAEPGALRIATEAARAAREIKVPLDPRLTADDATPEAVVTLMAEHGGRIAIVSPEGGGLFEMLAGRYSKSPNIDPYLKGHAGEPIRVDRKGRPPEYVPSANMSLCLAVQPSVLETIGKNEGFAGRGLLARILYSLPPSSVGSRRIRATPVPQAVADVYALRMRSLAVRLHRPGQDHITLTFTPQADDVLAAAEETLEPRLGPGGDLHGMRDWAGKYAGTVARLTGLLHMAEHGVIDGQRHPVEPHTVHDALRLGDYFLAHAQTVYGLMRADESTNNARAILSWVQGRQRQHQRSVNSVGGLERAEPDSPGAAVGSVDSVGAFTCSEREILRYVNKIGSREIVVSTNHLLETLGWVIQEEPPPSTGRAGRPPSPRWTFRPLP